MSRTFAELYRAEAYPAMSHPAADPLVNAAVARAAGLEVADPKGARILEIGCGTGHHILSLANRWPGAECTGVDISARAISTARNLARQAGLENVKFCECPLQEFEPEGGFDFIIAHGVFSWVPDEVKLALMDFIGKRLSPAGIAAVSFNVVAGWRQRMAVVEKVRAIQAAGAEDEMEAISLLMSVVEAGQKEIVADMLAKGPEVLAFDDFAPVMDAWSLGAFVKLADASGLKWLGDSVSGEREDDAADDVLKKTFRAELFCGADAVLGAMPEARGRPKIDATLKISDFPMLDAWRQVCAREALPLPDAELKSCMFSFPQLKVLAAMDGSLSVVALADHAKKVAPELDFIPWLRHVAERGLLV